MQAQAAPVQSGHRASALLEVLDTGRGSRCTVNRGAAPLTFRVTNERKAGVVPLTWVGTAAGPIGGDQLDLQLSLGGKARAEVSSAGAALVMPGPRGDSSSLDINVSLACCAELLWAPEPTVLCEGAVHHARTVIELAASAQLVWVDEVILGRHDAAPGIATTSLVIDLGGKPLLRNGLAIGAPGWDGPFGFERRSRYVAQIVAVGEAAPVLEGRASSIEDGLRAAGSGLDSDVDAHVRTVVADNALEGRSEVEAALALLG